MSEPRGGGGGGRGRLDATGDREVVYCHQCHAEWYNDEHGLTCPTCEGQITEIVTPGESDPRPTAAPQSQVPRDFDRIRTHNPWETTDSDPDEADIDEHITGLNGPGGGPRVTYFSQTIRSRGDERGHQHQHGEGADPGEVMANFQRMMGGIMGPAFEAGPPGRSGPDSLFNGGLFPAGRAEPGNFHSFGGRTANGHVMGARYTFTTNVQGQGGPAQARQGQGNDITSLLGNMFASMVESDDNTPEHGPRPTGGMPPGFQALFASLLNPANMRSGDAVYSQEALDQIISNLMEQHPQSNAPGPAAPDAIASLPKRNIDKGMLGDDGKAECSVCMDDVQLGEEVVVLPCTHWFHETCAGAWLSEHNTCPICRKGIDGGSTSSPNTQGGSSSSSSNPWRVSSVSDRPEQWGRSSTAGSRNEARLASIRRSGRLTPTHEDEAAAQARRRWQAVGDGSSRSPREVALSSSPLSWPSSPSRVRSTRQNSESSGRSLRSEQRALRRQMSTASQGEETRSSGPLSWLRSRWGDRSSRN